MTAENWLERVEHSWFRCFIINCIRAGALPKHLAFIMDGNRRFAKVKDITRLESYKMGFDKIGEILDYCETFHISTVSVYAFSIENFKRSEDEKKELFSLMSEKINDLIKEIDKLNEKGIRVHIMGNISLFSDDLRASLARLELGTIENAEFSLNLCLAYTSREEITNSVRCLAEGVAEGKLKVSDISEDMIDRSLYSEDQPPVDMLIRTSGEVRLSDYMLWQANFACLQFVKVLWPDFGFWHFIGALLDYQRQFYDLNTHRQTYRPFLDRIKHTDHEASAHEEHCTLETHDNCTYNAAVTEAYVRAHDKRCEQFLSDLKRKRVKYLERSAEVTCSGA